MNPHTIGDEKRHIRDDIAQRLAALQPAEIARKSRAICGKLIDYLESMEPQVDLLLAYSSMQREVQTDLLLNWAHTHQIALALPRISPQQRHMRFHLVKPEELDTSLETHRLGFKQPTEQLPLIEHGVFQTKNTVIIVPGMAFTATGERLGRGGGYYDRFLASSRDCVLPLGVCFREQVLESLPTTGHDQSISRLFTD
ncbi:MAG: 5-formyltetrahydrofolate cyclo-ligase [Spirochaetota bacterium]